MFHIYYLNTSGIIYIITYNIVLSKIYIYFPYKIGVNNILFSKYVQLHYLTRAF